MRVALQVEDLTRQLDELRTNRNSGGGGGGGGVVPGNEYNNNSPAFIELEKLRNEILVSTATQ